MDDLVDKVRDLGQRWQDAWVETGEEKVYKAERDWIEIEILKLILSLKG